MDEQSKEPWDVYPNIWSTKAKFFGWLRGALRRAIWEKYPPKIEFKNITCSPPPDDYEGKARSGANCALSGEWTGKSKLQVDHVKGNVSLREWEDVTPFIRHLAAAGYSQYENFQLVCKAAHEIKSHAERKGISYEEAVIDKQVIAFKKLKAYEQTKVVIGLHNRPHDYNFNKAKDRIAAFKWHLEQGGKDVN